MRTQKQVENMGVDRSSSVPSIHGFNWPTTSRSWRCTVYFIWVIWVYLRYVCQVDFRLRLGNMKLLSVAETRPFLTKFVCKLSVKESLFSFIRPLIISLYCFINKAYNRKYCSEILSIVLRTNANGLAYVYTCTSEQSLCCSKIRGVECNAENRADECSFAQFSALRCSPRIFEQKSSVLCARSLHKIQWNSAFRPIRRHNHFKLKWSEENAQSTIFKF